MKRPPIRRVPGIHYPHCEHCNAQVISRRQWTTEPCPATDGKAGHYLKPSNAMYDWVDYQTLEDQRPLPPASPRSHYGILSAAILPSDELLPLMNTMTLDEQIIVVGKLRALEVILSERIMHQDKWHPHHKILATDQKLLATVTEQANANDELLDAKEASRRLGYSVRWLYKNADSLPFTIREKTGRLRFSKHGLDEYLRNHGKPA